MPQGKKSVQESEGKNFVRSKLLATILTWLNDEPKVSTHVCSRLRLQLEKVFSMIFSADLFS